ncbi:hypothetical protein JZ751_027928 [Albula glossodonta]|uniref:BZIP domain-containing protein n=1 Tax=Albula glossodonta TaxID=121402 RepID=A0A8T2P7M3_9TELE|nr:hypothetical protein JZ751_027928 [Albula glossodonta]
MELTDILWKQDIDLGAGREAFDLCHRQKENELQKQKELEREKQQQLQREREMTLMAQQQLDEETGEFVSHTLPSIETPATALPHAASQVPPAQAPMLLTLQPPKKTPPDLEQTLVELLSISELQQCMNMQMDDMLEPAAYSTTGPTKVQEPNNFTDVQNITDAVAANILSPENLSTFEGILTSVFPPDSLIQTTLKPLELSATIIKDERCDMNCLDFRSKSKIVSSAASSVHRGSPMAKVPKEMPLKSIQDFKCNLKETYASNTAEAMVEIADSGLSLDARKKLNNSRNIEEKLGNRDSDTDEMEIKPQSTAFQADVHKAHSSVTSAQTQVKGTKARQPKVDLGMKGSIYSPLNKDKYKKSTVSHLSRDEQQVTALEIPISVDMIINLPVEEFNKMMSKEQLSEAQLALVRDIRRRGKNKVAAQNCRKRKGESVVHLEHELDSLKEKQDHLLRERAETRSSLQDMKQKLDTLNQEVFSLLRDKEGQPYSPKEYSLQQTSDGNVYLVPCTKITLVMNSSSHALL